MAGLEVKGAVAVITGASSGVGRAAAEAFATAGARLVLAARGEAALESAAETCRALGAEAVAAPTDVSRPEAVEALAKTAVDRFGRLDVWVNNAGVGAVGGFLETPLEEHDQIVRTNLLGYLYGAHAALARFKAQGRGVLIDMNSVGGFAAAPYAVGYSASKFGVRGLSLALRAELAGEPDIHVCEIYGSFLDTPGVEHAANHTGAKLRPTPPVNDPAKVAKIMVELVGRPRAEVMLDTPAWAIRLGATGLPRVAAWSLGRLVEGYAQVAERRPQTAGAVMAAAGGEGAVHGGLRRPGLRTAAALGALGVAAVALAASTRTLRSYNDDGAHS